MRLRNKKTGEISDYKDFEYDLLSTYNSLAELNDEWEDAPEEPKKYWYITGEGDICRDDIKHSEWIEERKSIGNYFETEEEAKKAVEKLKAWERLQKKFNFHITGWDVVDTQVIITTDCDFNYVKDRQDDGLWSDLDLVFNGNLLFGGEE